MLKMWHAAHFGIASISSKVGTVGYVLGKWKRMFNILTRVGEACQRVKQLYLGNTRFFFFGVYSMSAAREFSFYCQGSRTLMYCTSPRFVNCRQSNLFGGLVKQSC